MFRIRHAVDELGPPYLSYREFVTSPRFWEVVQMGLDQVSWRTERVIQIMFGPAKWMDWLVSRLFDHRSMLSWSWTALSYPFLALPAWAFVGWGLDGFFGRLAIGWKAAAASGLLVVAAGIWLAEARIWMLLFMIPALACWRRR